MPDRPSLAYRDPSFVPQQAPEAPWHTLAPFWPKTNDINNLVTGDPGRPQAVDDPAYTRRFEGTHNLPGVGRYGGTNEDYLENNSDLAAALRALSQYVGTDAPKGYAEGGQVDEDSDGPADISEAPPAPPPPNKLAALAQALRQYEQQTIADTDNSQPEDFSQRLDRIRPISPADDPGIGAAYPEVQGAPGDVLEDTPWLRKPERQI